MVIIIIIYLFIYLFIRSFVRSFMYSIADTKSMTIINTIIIITDYKCKKTVVL